MRKIGQLIVLIAFTMLFITNPSAAQKSWDYIGKPAFSAGYSALTTIAVDKNDHVYVAYLDGTMGRGTTVMKYDGTNWLPVGSPGFSPQITNNVVITLDNNDTPYVAFQDYPNYSRATVMKFNGSNWVKVGTGFSAGQAMDISLVFDSKNTPYVSYRDVANDLKATVMKYDGTNWVTVGPVAFTNSSVNDISIAIGKNDTPYVAYNGLAAASKVAIVKYNGTAWVPVSTPQPSIDANKLFLRFDSKDSLYLATNESDRYNFGIVYKFDGATWAVIGSALPMPIWAFEVDNNSTPYIGYDDSSNNNRASVIKYDGNGWAMVGKPGFSLSEPHFMDLLLDKNNAVFTCYVEPDSDSRVTVMKFDCLRQPKAGICAVLTDTTTGYNIIVWDGNSLYADSCKIYREDNGNYIHIGSRKGLLGSFTDLTANSSTNSYKYKLVILDSCERETHLDSTKPHKNVLLVFNYLMHGSASITWNAYEGISNVKYIVKRSNNNSPFISIDSFAITGSDTTYIDANPPQGTNNYRIDITHDQGCTAGNITYKILTSNIVTSWKTGISVIDNKADILLTPNPAYDKLYINLTTEIVKIEVFDMLGRKLISEKGNSAKEMILNVNDITPGMYMVRVNDSYITRFTKG